MSKAFPNSLPIRQHDSILKNSLSHRKFNFMSKPEEVCIHQKDQAVTFLASDWAIYDGSMYSISTHLIRMQNMTKSIQ